jgi:hypothetical protein
MLERSWVYSGNDPVLQDFVDLMESVVKCSLNWTLHLYMQHPEKGIIFLLLPESYRLQFNQYLVCEGGGIMDYGSI